jgi:hypothetical protein
MEHRLGYRLRINCIVRLRTGRGEVAQAELCDLSLSGAFVRTDLALEPSSPVRLSLPSLADMRLRNIPITAHVVRNQGIGIGLEWDEFAPAPVKAFLSGHWMREASERTRNTPSPS